MGKTSVVRAGTVAIINGGRVKLLATVTVEELECAHCLKMLHGICKKCGRHCSCYDGVPKSSSAYKRALC